MRASCIALGPFVRGNQSQAVISVISACFLGVISPAAADPSTATVPDPPSRLHPPVVGPSHLRASSVLDGLYLWLGPTGAASRVDGQWDSTFGGQGALLRVREQATLGVIGGSLGASLWTERTGGRIWGEAVLGTRLIGHMVGASVGPIVELGDLAHPRFGGTVGLWAFVGVTPFVRFGMVDELGGFAEVGLHIALPVLRR